MASSDLKPPMDHELRAALDKISFPAISELTPDVINMMRIAAATPPAFITEQKARGISHREIKVASRDGFDIILSILEPEKKSTAPRPCMYWMHGGGFHWGDRLHTLEFPTDVVLECNAIVISVEYRMSPEFPLSTSLEDSYTGLVWVNEHAIELGIDPKRLMVGGTSAGGTLAASIAILCRDRQGPALCAQALICPALDDRLETVSSKQFVDASDFFPREVFEGVWESTLKGSRDDLKSALPAARANDLSGLPTTYLDVGSAELLRDEVVAYASMLWASGVQAELHVWAGGFHGFDIFLPDAAVSRASRKAKIAWTKKIFGIDP